MRLSVPFGVISEKPKRPKKIFHFWLNFCLNFGSKNLRNRKFVKWAEARTLTVTPVQPKNDILMFVCLFVCLCAKFGRHFGHYYVNRYQNHPKMTTKFRMAHTHINMSL